MGDDPPQHLGARRVHDAHVSKVHDDTTSTLEEIELAPQPLDIDRREKGEGSAKLEDVVLTRTRGAHVQARSPELDRRDDERGNDAPLDSLEETDEDDDEERHGEDHPVAARVPP